MTTPTAIRIPNGKWVSIGMYAKTWKFLLAPERDLGDVGIVRWTNSLKFYKGRAEVTKVNAKTLRAKLLEDVPSQLGYQPYKAGREIIVPIPGTLYNRFDSEAT